MQTDKIRKCPKCGNNASSYEEISRVGQIFDIEDGKIDRDGFKTLVGHVDKVRAYCDQCDYEWTVRGVTQVNDLFA